MKNTPRLSLALITFSLSILYLATTVHAQDCAQFSGSPKAACEAAAGGQIIAQVKVRDKKVGMLKSQG